MASRRAAEQLVLEGRVRVNGQVVRELGARADAAQDRIEVDGKPIQREQHAYYLVHKPRGMVTTLHDPEGRPTLAELLGGISERVYPVGRLDFNTSGVLLVTNDGDLAQALLHPSREVPKTYVAKLNELVDERPLDMLRRGVTLDDGYYTAPARVNRLRDEEGHTWLELTITEGKNRQIHRMIEVVGVRVMRLARKSFAGLSSDGLKPGEVRPLEPSEIAALRRTYQGGADSQVELVPLAHREPRPAYSRAADSRPRHDAPKSLAGATGAVRNDGPERTVSRASERRRADAGQVVARASGRRSEANASVDSRKRAHDPRSARDHGYGQQREPATERGRESERHSASDRGYAKPRGPASEQRHEPGRGHANDRDQASRSQETGDSRADRAAPRRVPVWGERREGTRGGSEPAPDRSQSSESVQRGSDTVDRTAGTHARGPRDRSDSTRHDGDKARDDAGHSRDAPFRRR